MALTPSLSPDPLVVGLPSDTMNAFMDILQYLLLFTIGIVSGFLNVMAGGGSTLTLPVLIFMGLDSALANGTNRIHIITQNIAAVASFRKQEVHEFQKSLRLTLWTLPGAIAGAILAVNVSDALFQKLLGVVLVGTVFTILIPQKPHGPHAGGLSRHREKWIYPAMFGIGFYGGFIQVSVGFLFMAALYHLLKMNLVYVNMHKVTIVLMYMVPALLIFAVTGNVNWGLGLVLGAGGAIGGWWAAHASVKGGEKLIRVILAVAIVVMALKLFELF